MRTRVALVSIAVIAAIAACGNKKSDGPGAGGSAAGSGGAGAGAGGSGSGAPGGAAAGSCIPSDPANVLAAFVADDKTATFCIGKEDDDQVAPKCMAVELATGTYGTAAAAPTAPPPPAPALMIKQEPRGVEACKGTACKKLELPRPKVEDGEPVAYQVAVSSDGKRLAATGGELGGVVFLDGTTGKKLKAVKLESADTCVEGAHFVGDAVYVATSNCAGPGGRAVLYAADGKQLGNIGPGDFNTYDAEPVHVGGDHWALVGYGGGRVLVFDARTGKQVHLVEMKAPEGCAQCGEVLGNAEQWSAAPIAKLPSGKLATIGGAGVTILDPASGKIEQTHPLPICPPKP
jgi:hypothetical protein